MKVRKYFQQYDSLLVDRHKHEQETWNSMRIIKFRKWLKVAFWLRAPEAYIWKEKLEMWNRQELNCNTQLLHLKLAILFGKKSKIFKNFQYFPKKSG